MSKLDINIDVFDFVICKTSSNTFIENGISLRNLTLHTN